MELAGLEPATSWVRSSRPPTLKGTLLQRFMAERLECRNISRNSVHRVLQRARGWAAKPASGAQPFEHRAVGKQEPFGRRGDEALCGHFAQTQHPRRASGSPTASGQRIGSVVAFLAGRGVGIVHVGVQFASGSY
jgi:hypothetical protein